MGIPDVDLDELRRLWAEMMAEMTELWEEIEAEFDALFALSLCPHQRQPFLSKRRALWVTILPRCRSPDGR